MPDICTRLTILVQPRARRNEVVGLHDDAVKIRLTAVPVDNDANRGLIEFLAERLELPKHHLRLVSGFTARRKVVEVQGLTRAQAMARLLPSLRA